MATYSMAEIATLTGIKAHTLRKWESRYDFIIPHRTKTNIRYYSDQQLRKLLNIGILVRNGNRVSQVDKMTEAEIHERVSNILIDSGHSDEINALIISMIKMDELAFDEIIDRNVENKGLLKTVTEVIYPFLNQIGILWTTHKAMPAQEHFISSLIYQKIAINIESIPKRKAESKRVHVLFLPKGEEHELGLYFMEYLLRLSGENSIYLGRDIPSIDLKLIFIF